jgi:hypothetical protein
MVSLSPWVQTSVAVVAGRGSNNRLQNKALERTRRVGVPASRAVVGVPPCRSTPCYAGPGAESGCE